MLPPCLWFGRPVDYCYPISPYLVYPLDHTRVFFSRKSPACKWLNAHHVFDDGRLHRHISKEDSTVQSSRLYLRVLNRCTLCAPLGRVNFALGVVFGSFVIVALFCGWCVILWCCLGLLVRVVFVLVNCECVDVCAVAFWACVVVVGLCGVATINAVEISCFSDCILCSG